ncbi:MAG TPA: hypothetical protein VN806_09115, partial [Caulobacteraceae bacterium]|nr:hypothetical protein [Caulobacteraceae bacterium]
EVVLVLFLAGRGRGDGGDAGVGEAGHGCYLTSLPDGGKGSDLGNGFGCSMQNMRSMRISTR